MWHGEVVIMDRQVLALLNPVVESARAELADIEPDDVPARLRRVSRSSARTLPPPLARSVINELTRSESFRSAVAERYQRSDNRDEDLVAFLDDPDKGIAPINDRGRDLADLNEQSGLREVSRKNEILSEQLAESHRRMDALRSEHADEIEAVQASVMDRRTRLEARIETLAADVAERDEKISDLATEVSSLGSELSSVNDKLRWAVERNRRRGNDAVPAVRGARLGAPSDPVEFARWLDAVERNARPFRASVFDVHDASDPEPLEIKPGISPDSGLALSTLLAQTPERFILDGYNVAGELYDEAFSTRPARDGVVERAGRLARASGAEVLVIFDGPPDKATLGFRSADGVVVRFSSGEKADDAIVALVVSDTMRTVVITNDRELRDRCSVAACVPIWSTAFLEWLRSN
jgi:uncharacterized coiled-coil protein SlyX